MQVPRPHPKQLIRICIYQDSLEIHLTVKSEKHWFKGVLKLDIKGSELVLVVCYQILIYGKQNSLFQRSERGSICFLPTRSKYC